MNKGVVIKSTGSNYIVLDADHNKYTCKIRGKFRTKGLRTTNPLAVGDYVEFTPSTADELGIITKRLDRKNYLIRKSINLSKEAHVLAANIDQAILIVTLTQPKTYPEFIDRFLVSAEAYGIPAIIIFNKIDLLTNEDEEQLKEFILIYEKIGYKCIQTSAKQNIGVSDVKAILQNKMSVISGHSGVGKSTLVNAIEPSLNLKTNAISDYHETGKHTTTFPEMHLLADNTYIIDTPGIKGFGMIDIKKEELMHFFPEIFALLPKCKYNNCLHLQEPQCAVKEAVQNNEISQSRYKSYINILNSNDDEKHRTLNY